MLIWAVVYILIWMSLLGLATWLSKYEKNHTKKVVASKTTLFHVLHSYKAKNPYYLYDSYRK